MTKQFIIIVGKLLSSGIKTFNLGNGSTWPGHIALKFNKNFIRSLLTTSRTKVIFVVGTNGKTTTTSLIKHILEKAGNTVIQNQSGANLLNGIASTLLLNATFLGKVEADYAIFEIDENIFPLICKEVTPDLIVVLNLFRDQLDRYGEVTSIANKWKKALYSLPEKTTLVLNADDPLISYLGEESSKQVAYFGLDGADAIAQKMEHAVDSIYCPRCTAKLTYKKIFYSHLGIWECPKCELKRPDKIRNSTDYYPLDGTYNKSNIHAAVTAAYSLGIDNELVQNSLKSFTPIFGRQEEITLKNKKIKMFLVKNPAGFNETIRTIQKLNGKHFILALNDRVADGKDVSWIWDVDFEILSDKKNSFILTGDRVYDLRTRLKYAGIASENIEIYEGSAEALTHALMKTSSDETLYILPTYTAMLDLRKEITGKKIL